MQTEERGVYSVDLGKNIEVWTVQVARIPFVY